MSIQILTTAEPLLKVGHYVGMIPPGPGGWGEKYPNKWYQVVFALPVLRDWQPGIMPSKDNLATDAVLTIDPDDDVGLEPRYYSTIYQARIGVSPEWMCYLRWPTNEYRFVLEESTMQPVPTEQAADPYRAYLGFVDSAISPISDPNDPDYPMRYELFFVRDWMPEFHAYVNSMRDYVKIIMRFLINKCTIQPVTDEAIRGKLDRKEIPYKPVFHYSVYVARAEGITA